MPHIVNGYALPEFPYNSDGRDERFSNFTYDLVHVLKERRDEALKSFAGNSYHHNFSIAVRTLNKVRLEDDQNIDLIGIFYDFLFAEPDVPADHIHGTYRALKSMHPYARVRRLVTVEHFKAYAEINSAFEDWDEQETLSGSVKKYNALIQTMARIAFEDLNPENTRILAHLIRRNVVSEHQVREQLRDLKGVSTALLDGSL